MVKYRITFDFDLDEILDQADYDHHIDIIELNDTGDYKNNKELKKISDNEKWNFRYTDVYCHGNIMQENNIRYLPFYMILFYGKKKEKPTQKYTIDLSALKF